MSSVKRKVLCVRFVEKMKSFLLSTHMLHNATSAELYITRTVSKPVCVPNANGDRKNLLKANYKRTPYVIQIPKPGESREGYCRFGKEVKTEIAPICEQ